MAKRFLTPVEINKEMDESRKAMGLDDVAEKVAISAMVDTAKSNTKIGDKLILVVKPAYIHMPNWQRETDISRANTIGQRYNPYKWELPKVLYDKGKLICIDGQHRIYGAYRNGIRNITVEILDGITTEEAIDLFLGQTDDRRRMAPKDTYRAALTAKKPEYVAMSEICKRNGVMVKGYDDNGTKKKISSITDAIKLVRTDPKMFENIIKLVSGLNWCECETGLPYGAKVFRTFRKLYGIYSGREVEMERVLNWKCKGAAFFENAYKKSENEFFDYINGIVEDNIGKVALKVV